MQEGKGWIPFYVNCELDSHADTSVAGANFVVLEYTDLTIECI